MQNICFMRAMELRVENTHRHFKFAAISSTPLYIIMVHETLNFYVGYGRLIRF